MRRTAKMYLICCGTNFFSIFHKKQNNSRKRIHFYQVYSLILLEYEIYVAELVYHTKSKKSILYKK